MKDKDFILALGAISVLKDHFKLKPYQFLNKEDTQLFSNKIVEKQSELTEEQLKELYIDIVKKYIKSLNKPAKKKKRKR